MKAQSAPRLTVFAPLLIVAVALLGCAEDGTPPDDADGNAPVLQAGNLNTSSFTIKPPDGSRGGPGKTCRPNCKRAVCGDDGCGGSCGTCGDDQACQRGQCVFCPISKPPSCDDGDACTDDVSVSDPGSCTSSCLNVPIVLCRGGDGCCPSGCDADTDTDCATTCGNGAIEANETCDPPSSCPTSCAPAGACATATLVGNAATCTAACVYEAVSSCAAGDGCCPQGCDAISDSDCPASCDNSVLEPGEACDPISNCPTTCDDGNACTVDAVSGSALNCTSRCVSTPISACAGGDGCCPAGCSSASDNDCAAVCGNGTLEAGETCDPPGSCPYSCNDGDACTVDRLLGSPTTCTAQCSFAPVTTCQNGDGCCPVGCSPSNDTDCGIDCHNAASWPAQWVAFEDELLALVNNHRVAGTDCPSETKNPVPPLTTDARLTEAARCHSVDMAVNDFFSHFSSDGSFLSDRLDAVGYQRTQGGENIAGGFPTASSVVEAWMSSPGHCRNVMSPSYTESGVGYYYQQGTTYTYYWMQNYGAP